MQSSVARLVGDQLGSPAEARRSEHPASAPPARPPRRTNFPTLRLIRNNRTHFSLEAAPAAHGAERVWRSNSKRARDAPMRSLRVVSPLLLRFLRLSYMHLPPDRVQFFVSASLAAMAISSPMRLRRTPPYIRSRPPLPRWPTLLRPARWADRQSHSRPMAQSVGCRGGKLASMICGAAGHRKTIIARLLARWAYAFVAFRRCSRVLRTSNAFHRARALAESAGTLLFVD